MPLPSSFSRACPRDQLHRVRGESRASRHSTPLGPERSRVVCDWLFAPEEIARSGFDPSDTVAVFDITNRQDWDVCERTQLGMRSRAFVDGGLYVTNEQHIAGFRDLVLERLGDPS